MGPHLDWDEAKDTAQISPDQLPEQSPDRADVKEATPAKDPDPDAKDPDAKDFDAIDPDAKQEQPAQRPSTVSSLELRAWDLRTLYYYIFRDVAVTSLPVILLMTPYWAFPRALRPDLDFTAKEFRAECDAFGKSDNEDSIAAGVIQIIGWLLFTSLIISVYFLLPMEKFTSVEESDLIVKKVRGLRHWWGAGYVFFSVAHFALRAVWAFEANQANGMINNAGQLLFLLGFICYAVGFARQGGALSEPWARTGCGLFVAGFGLIVWLTLCMQLVLNANGLLFSNGTVAVVGLTLASNLVEFACKRAVVMSGCHPSFLGFLTMGIGVAASFPIRIFAFLKPTVVDALIVGVVSAIIEVAGQGMNVFKLRVLPKFGFPMEPKAMECFGYQVYTQMVFEITARVIALLVLLAADTRYYTFAGVGFNFAIDPGLVVLNFFVAVFLMLLTNTAITYLLSANVPEINIASTLQNKGLRVTIFGFATLVAAVSKMAVNGRWACLRCGEAATWTCFD